VKKWNRLKFDNYGHESGPTFSGPPCIYRVSIKCHPIFSWLSRNWTDLNNFWYTKMLKKFDVSIKQVCCHCSLKTYQKGLSSVFLGAIGPVLVSRNWILANTKNFTTALLWIHRMIWYVHQSIGHVTVQHCSHVTVQLFWILHRSTVHHSIMTNVTWRRFDQSVKQLIVGQWPMVIWQMLRMVGFVVTVVLQIYYWIGYTPWARKKEPIFFMCISFNTW